MATGVELAAAYISITPSARNIQRDLEREIVRPADQAGQKAGKSIEDGLSTGASRGATAAKAAISVLSSAAVLSGLNRAKDAASNLQQAVGGTVSVFGEQADAVEEAAERSADSMGLSERAFREMTSQIGASLKGYGFAVDEAADKSIELTQLGADLAATFGGTTADAVAALSSALRGEFDPLERYGIALRQSAIDAKAVELGLAQSTSTVDAHARAQASLALITEQSADAQGAFGRESDTAAGQAARSQAKIEDATAKLGAAILPIYARIAEAGGTIADVFAALPTSVQTGLVAIAAVVAIAGPIQNVVGLYRSLTPAVVASTAATSANTGAVVANAAATNSAAAVQTLYATSAGRAAIAQKALTGALKVGATVLAGYAIAQGIVNASRKDAEQTGEDLANQFTEEFGAATTAAERIAIVNQRISEYNATVDDAQSGLDIFDNDDLSQVAEEIGPVIEREQQLIGVLEGVRAAGGDVNEANEILGTSYARIAELIEDGYTPVQIVATIEAEKNAAAQQRNAAAVADTTREVEDQRAAIDEIIRSMREYHDQVFGTTDAQIAFNNATAELALGLAATNGEIDLNTEAGQANYEAIQDAHSALTDLIARRYEETGSVADATEAGNLYIAQLRTQLQQIGLTEGEIDTLITQYGLVPSDIATNFRVNTAEAVRQLQDFQRQLAGVAEGSYEVDITARRGPGGGTARASGGTFAANEVLTVGERGWEAAVFGQGGRILSHEDSMMAVAMGASAAVGTTAPAYGAPPGSRQYQQNFYGPTDPERVGREVRRVEMVYR